eukprot:Opistho-2@56494
MPRDRGTSPRNTMCFFCDPEAAHIVLSSCDALHRCTLIPWELCVDSRLSWADYDALVGLSSAADCPDPATVPSLDPAHRGRYFLRAVCAAYVDWSRPQFDGTSHHHAFLPCDAYAVAAAIVPGIVKGTTDLYGQIELAGTLTRGMCVWDWYNRRPHKPNATVVTAIDRDAFVACLKHTFA